MSGIIRIFVAWHSIITNMIITNLQHSVEFTQGSDVQIIPKQGMSTRVKGDFVIVTSYGSGLSNSGDNAALKVNWRSVTSPSVISASNLSDILIGYVSTYVQLCQDNRMTFNSGKLEVNAEVAIGTVDIGLVHIADPLTNEQVNVIENLSGAIALEVHSEELPLPAGAATAAKQLEDGHNVTVDNTVEAPVNVNITNANGFACTLNSTSTPLLANATFTGAWVDTVQFGTIIVGIISDKNSAINGLRVEYSANGVDKVQDDTFTILANTGKSFTFGMPNRYFRVVYVNGAENQGLFNLQVIVKKVSIKNSSHRISDSIIGEDDAELIKSVITGSRDDGVFQNVKVDNGGCLRVNSFPYTYAIAEGDIDSHYSLLKFGTRTSLLANTQSVIWEGSTALYPYMTSAQQLKISSTSAQDGGGGTGMITMRIHGLDANWDEISEDITLNGISKVTTTSSFLRIFRAYGLTCGTLLSNAGKITILNNSETTEQLVINIKDGQTLMTLWSVPRGKNAYLLAMSVSTDSAKGLGVSLFTKSSLVNAPWLIKYRGYIVGGNNNSDFKIPFKISEKTDIEIRAISPGSAGTTSAGATFELWYENV